MPILNLEHKIVLDDKAIESPNLCNRFSDGDLDAIGQHVYANYRRDKQSREHWERRMENALDLAMQIQKDKTFPWPGCANIAFPLVTIAALQFHARAYPAIVNGRSVVQCRVNGDDKNGAASERATRIAKYMSYQLLEQDEGWEEDTDRCLLNLAIIGCGFKKTLYNSSLGYPISSFVQAKDLIVNYYAKSIESAPVKTHWIPMSRNDIYERALSGTYVDCTNDAWFEQAPAPIRDQQDDAEDNRAGVHPGDPDHDTPFIILEQHLNIDLDDDGYDEPYIITIEESSQKVLRIVTRFDRKEDIERDSRNRIIRINPMEYFTKIPFIPSPDGGIYDIGFGMLLGPLNESVNSALNQLFDAGTLSNTSGGFLGRGAKIKGGVYQFAPFSWQRVDATGDDLRKSIYPLPVREPSAVMFQLLGLLIDYTNRISGATDMLVGENPGQNTPAETSRAMIEQGQKIYSAIFKRIWRGLKQEFKKLYIINGIYLSDRVAFGASDYVTREDFTITAAITPAADPTIASDGARYARATMVAERAGVVPGYNTDETERMVLKELGVDNIELIFPGSANMPPGESEKVTIQRMKNEMEQLRLQSAQQQFVITMQSTIALNNAKILELEASAAKLQAEAANVGEDNKINAFRAGIEAIRAQNEQLEKQVGAMMEGMREQTNTGTGGVPGMAQSPSNTTVYDLGGGSSGTSQGIMG